MTTLIESLLALHLREFTGKIQLKKDQVTKTIFFKKGNPIFCDSTIRSETLGQLLLERKILTEEQYREVIAKMHELKKRQGEIIVQLGFLSGFEVYEALKDQAARKVQNCVLLEGADVESSEGEEHLKGVPELPIEFFRVFLDTVSSTFMGDETNFFPDNQAIQLTTEGRTYLSKQSLSPIEARLTNMLDGKRSEEFLYSRLDRDDVQPILLAFSQMDFLEFVDLPPQRFTIPASQAKDSSKSSPPDSPTVKNEEDKKRVVEIKEEKAPKAPSNPIYVYAIRLNQPHHDLLEIRPNANRFEIKRQFESLVRKLGLEAISKNYQGADLEIAEKVFDRLTFAYTVLSDDKRRHEYFQSIAQRKPIPERPTPEIEAESCVQKANLFQGSKDFDRAEIEIRRAIELVPKESSFHVELAQLTMQRALSLKQPIPEEVESILKEALKLNSSDSDAFYQLGEIYKVRGDLDKALGCFQRAVDHRPSFSKAMAELRLLNMRAESKRAESPLLKLFKKKDS